MQPKVWPHWVSPLIKLCGKTWNRQWEWTSALTHTPNIVTALAVVLSAVVICANSDHPHSVTGSLGWPDRIGWPWQQEEWFTMSGSSIWQICKRIDGGSLPYLLSKMETDLTYRKLFMSNYSKSLITNYESSCALEKAAWKLTVFYHNPNYLCAIMYSFTILNTIQWPRLSVLVLVNIPLILI